MPVLLTRLRSDRVAIGCACLVTALILVAILAPVIVDVFGVSGPQVRNPGAVNAFGLPAGPSAAHPLGVDDVGRDVLARVVYGTRPALEAGLLGALLATVIGGALGLAAGFWGRWIDPMLGWVSDGFMVFPVLLLGLGIGSACRAGGCVGGAVQPGIATVLLIIALARFSGVARTVRDAAASLRGRGFVEAARASGASSRRLLRREILPNLVGRLTVCLVLLIPLNILLEAALSFLGVGVGGQTADWGQMIWTAGQDILRGESVWWYLVFPGVALSLTVAIFNLLAARLLAAMRATAAEQAR